MSGTKLALGSVAALVAISRRGSQNILEPSKWMVTGRFNMKKALESLEEFQETLVEEHGGHYSRGQNRYGDPRKGFAYVFNVKMWRAPSYPPDYEEVSEKYGISEEEADAIVWERISDEREYMHQMLKDDYDWIEEIESAGGSGGYLVVVGDYDFEEDILELEDFEPEQEFSIAGPRYHSSDVSIVREIYSRMYGRLKDLNEIEKRLLEFIEGVAAYVASDEFWEEEKDSWEYSP